MHPRTTTVIGMRYGRHCSLPTKSDARLLSRVGKVRCGRSMQLFVKGKKKKKLWYGMLSLGMVAKTLSKYFRIHLIRMVYFINDAKRKKKIYGM